MNGHGFTLDGASLVALPSGALWWPDRGILTVSDLHLCKSERIARRGGAMLPPYETRDTLARLDADIAATRAETVICLGDSFDDLAAAEGMDDPDILWLTRLMAGRRWIWIEGNHDPGPLGFGGSHLVELVEAPLVFRHIARPGAPHAEISGHYHPKMRVSLKGKSISRACFLYDDRRVIMPAYGTYTGGLRSHAPTLDALMGPGACAVLTGTVARALPMRGSGYARPAASTSAR